MTAHHEATVICDVCFSSYSLVGSKNLRAARYEAAQNGWVREGKHDYCSQAHAEVAALRAQWETSPNKLA